MQFYHLQKRYDENKQQCPLFYKNTTQHTTRYKKTNNKVGKECVLCAHRTQRRVLATYASGKFPEHFVPVATAIRKFFIIFGLFCYMRRRPSFCLRTTLCIQMYVCVYVYTKKYIYIYIEIGRRIADHKQNCLAIDFCVCVMCSKQHHLLRRIHRLSIDSLWFFEEKAT